MRLWGRFSGFGRCGIVGSWDRYLWGAAASRPRRRADRGGSPRWPLAAGSSPALAWPLERRAVDNFPHLRVLWIARKSLISFITYARLTKIITHDIHYVKS